jgi:hypothetical protein
MFNIKENLALTLWFILGILIAAGIIFFIVIGFSMVFGVTPPKDYHKYGEPLLYNAYNGMTLSFLFKGGTGTINETECDSNSKQWGENCTCRSCMAWSGYDTNGFINRTGIYYSDGTLVGIPRQEVDKFVELNRTKYPFEFIIQGHNGFTYNGEQWSKNGESFTGSEHVGSGEGLGNPMEYECLINGAYYPSSSGKCTVNFIGDGNGITGPGEGVSGLQDTYNYNLTYYNYTIPLQGDNRTYTIVTGI